MNIGNLKKAVDEFVNTTSGALITTDLFDTFSGMTIAGHNSNPTASALFNKIYNELLNSLGGSGFENELKYYYLFLESEQIVIVGQIQEMYRYAMIVDLKQIPLGMLLGILLPKYLKSVEEALS